MIWAAPMESEGSFKVEAGGGGVQESQFCRGCDGGRDHEPRNAGGLKKEGKAGR